MVRNSPCSSSSVESTGERNQYGGERKDLNSSAGRVELTGRDVRYNPAASLEVPRAERTSDLFVKIHQQVRPQGTRRPVSVRAHGADLPDDPEFHLASVRRARRKGPSRVGDRGVLPAVDPVHDRAHPADVGAGRGAVRVQPARGGERGHRAQGERREPVAARDAGARGGRWSCRSSCSRSTTRCCRGRTIGSRRCRTTSRRRSRPSC